VIASGDYPFIYVNMLWRNGRGEVLDVLGRVSRLATNRKTESSGIGKSTLK
jgi:hypothetical protein